MALLGVVSFAAGATPGEKLDDVQTQLDRANGKLGANRARAGVLTTDIAGYTTRIRRVEARLASLQPQVSSSEGQLATATAELGRRQRELRRERAKLVRLRIRLQRSQKILAERLVSLYKADNPDVLTAVLETEGFAQLVDNAAFLRRVGRQDTLVLDAVRTAKTDSERQTARLKRLEATQQTVTERREREHDRVIKLRDGIAAARQELATAREARQRKLDATRVLSRELEGEVQSLQRVQSRIQRQLTAAQSRNSGTFGTAPSGPVKPGSGGWVWPVNGTLASPFCEVRSYESCHPGIDIAAPEGTPIRAAKSGRVVLLQSEAASGGYGNYTCIQHDATTSSCYAHQSRFGTSSGATVSTGQVIGYVGSTGHSTGPHLHFEVRVNGSVVNPMNYL